MNYLQESPKGDEPLVPFSGGRFRFSPFAVVLSVLCGILLFFLFKVHAREDAAVFASGEGCVVIVTEESRDDRLVRETLERGGIEGLISESSQKIPVDNFGSLKMVSLDSFRDEIETFDPRDTGYAGKLRAFFVREGKRFFFLPLDNASGLSTAKLEKNLSRLLGDIPYTLTFLGKRSPFFWYFLLLAAACGAALFFSREKRLLAYEMPVLLAFGWGGPFAFILAALLTGIWELLREPIGEFSAARLYGRSEFDYAGKSLRGLWERLKPFRINCVLAVLFVILFAALSIAGAFPALPLALGSGFFFLLCFLAPRAERSRVRQSGHIPFVPVLMFPVKKRTFSLFPLLLPFGAMSMAALFLPMIFPSFSPFPENDPALDSRYFIEPSEYERYIAFQNSFSYRPLNEPPETLNPGGYLRYYLGDDGLIAGSAGSVPGQNGEAAAPPGGDGPGDMRSAESPPFPLEKLMRFLIQYGKPREALSRGEGWPRSTVPAEDIGKAFYARIRDSLLTAKGWIPVLMIFTASALNLLQPGILTKRKKTLLFGDKRIAA